MTDGHKDKTSSDAYHRLTERVGSAYSSAVEKTTTVVGEATSTVGANPVAALLGGLVVGVVAGALIPAGEKERSLLAPTGAKLGDAARAAFEAAKASGAEALADAGLDKEQLRSQASRLLDGVVKAAGSAGSAALQSARGGKA